MTDKDTVPICFHIIFCMHAVRHAMHRTKGYAAHGNRRKSKNKQHNNTYNRIWLLGGIYQMCAVCSDRSLKCENNCIAYGAKLIVAVVLSFSSFGGAMGRLRFAEFLLKLTCLQITIIIFNLRKVWLARGSLRCIEGEHWVITLGYSSFCKFRCVIRVASTWKAHSMRNLHRATRMMEMSLG